MSKIPFEKKKKNDFKQPNSRPNTPRQVSGGQKRSNKKKQPAELDAALFQKKAVSGKEKEASVYVASRKISELPINETLRDNLLKKGYEYPTEIQDKSLDAMLDRQDVLGIAQTGTGKTG